jgi:hypothetical protein
MGTRATISLLALALTLTLTACGVKDLNQESSIKPQLTCLSQPKLMMAGEVFRSEFLRANTSASIDSLIDVGDSLLFLDWGTISSTSETTSDYTAPAFVPESRKINIVGKTGDGGEGACPTYLLQSGDLGVADDGVVDGIVAEVFSYPTAPATFPVDYDFPSPSGLTLNNKAVVREMNVSVGAGAAPTGLTGLTTNYLVRYRGTLIVNSSGSYRVRLSASDQGRITFNGQQRTSTGAFVNLDSTLSAGRYPFEILHAQNASGGVSVRLEWAPATGATTFATPTLVPYAAFDRP